MGAGDTRYWIRSGTAVQGPFEAERVRAWIASGRVRPEMEFSTDGATFVPSSRTRGLFPEPEPEPAAKERPRRAGRAGGRGATSGERPPPGISVFCRLIAALVLTAAWVIGQWAHVSVELGEIERGAEFRVMYGLHGAEVIVGRGTQWVTLWKDEFSNEGELEGISTTIALGWAITGLVALTILGCVASAAVVWGMRRLPAVGFATLLASFLVVALGVAYMNAGVVAKVEGLLAEAVAGSVFSEADTSVFPGVSFWLGAGAFVFVAVASLFDRLAALEATRRRRTNDRAFR
jgi:hypothetical protein